MARLHLLAAIPLAALLLFGCGDDDSPVPTPPGGTPTAEATSTPFEGDTAPVTATAPAGLEAALLEDVRAASHEGYDRIVFEFEGTGVPGYRVEYTSEAIACGSGEDRATELGEGTVPAAILLVQMQPANAHTEEGVATVPLRIDPNLSALRAALLTCDFEADVTYHLALTAEQPFAVSVLDNPPRLVVDIANDE
ncbi:MAG TPA: hypothetical protein PJ994_00120 [Tepidiformaceae bacterium]|nr:hypothetical protein [Tepidiformaceae bacterium]